MQYVIECDKNCFSCTTHEKGCLLFCANIALPQEKLTDELSVILSGKSKYEGGVTIVEIFLVPYEGKLHEKNVDITMD